MTTRLLALFIVFMTLPSFASQELYVPPRSIELKMSHNGNKGENHRFSAEIKSLIGSLQDIKVYYEAVDGAVCLPAPLPVKILAEGEARKFDFVIKLPAMLAADPQSWVRFRVEYLPDYDAIKKNISSDSATYPDENLRNQLLEIVDQNIAARARAVDAIRHFFEKSSD